MNAAPSADANAVRTPRTISIHLTAFAPGCVDLDDRDPRRWKTFWHKEPTLVVPALLKRLQRAPQAVRGEREHDGGVVVMARFLEAHTPGCDPVPEGDVPVAMIYDGLSLEEFNAVLVRLGAQPGGMAA